jgi:hypothetical protein
MIVFYWIRISYILSFSCSTKFIVLNLRVPYNFFQHAFCVYGAVFLQYFGVFKFSQHFNRHGHENPMTCVFYPYDTLYVIFGEEDVSEFLHLATLPLMLGQASNSQNYAIFAVHMR